MDRDVVELHRGVFKGVGRRFVDDVGATCSSSSQTFETRGIRIPELAHEEHDQSVCCYRHP